MGGGQTHGTNKKVIGAKGIGVIGARVRLMGSLGTRAPREKEKANLISKVKAKEKQIR